MPSLTTNWLSLPFSSFLRKIISFYGIFMYFAQLPPLYFWHFFFQQNVLHAHVCMPTRLSYISSITVLLASYYDTLHTLHLSLKHPSTIKAACWYFVEIRLWQYTYMRWDDGGMVGWVYTLIHIQTFSFSLVNRKQNSFFTLLSTANLLHPKKICVCVYAFLCCAN